MKTKTIFTLLLAFMCVVFLHAQEGDEEMKMLFPKKDKSNSEKKMHNGGYGAVTMGWTQINKENAIIIGARAAWIANRHFGLGFAGRGFFNNLNSDRYHDPGYVPNADPNYTLTGGYGGILLEPIVAPMSPVHVSFPILIGAGGVTALPANLQHVDNYNNYYYATDAFFVFEPGVDVEFNITKFFRIALGASYRYTSNIYLEHKYVIDGEQIYDPVPKDALRAFNLDLSLKFGWF